MSDLTVFRLGLIGGLEDSQAEGKPENYVRLENWTTFRGRFALRAPIFLTTTLTASDANATRALGGAFHDGKLWLAVFRDANDDVRLWELTTAGVFTADRGALWTGITGAVPRPVFAPFEGGSAAGGTKRLYVADYDEQQVTKFWDGTSISSLQVDFDNSGTAEDVRYHYVFPYQFHLWGAGFFQGTTGRKEMLRFSQPGLIPADDPDTTLGTLVEWFAADFRPVGRRGDKITNIGVSGGPMIVFKDRQTFALFGYDSQSWAIRQLSERVGAVGPYASASTGDGLCFFWTDRGPHVTDGQTVTDISEKVRKHVLEAEVSDKVVVGFSPDDGIAYFIHPRGGSTEPDRWLGFDKERTTWTEGEGFATGGGLLQVKHSIVVPSASLPGPAGAPSSLALTVLDENSIQITWVNGDTALDTATLVDVALSAGGAPVQAFGLSSGIVTITAFSLTPKTTYFVRARHKRNTIFSGYSNEPSAKTFLARPINPSAIRRPTGARYIFTNQEAGADIVIERKLSSSSSYEVLTTLISQAATTINYDDTTAVCGSVYDFRSKAQKAGETDSVYSTTATSAACNPPSLNTATHVLTLQSYCGYYPNGPTRVAVSWTGTNLHSTQIVKVYRNVAGAGYVLVSTVSATQLSITDLWTVKSGGTQKTLQYRVDLLEGDVVVSSLTTTQTSPFVDDCI